VPSRCHSTPKNRIERQSLRSPFSRLPRFRWRDVLVGQAGMFCVTTRNQQVWSSSL
jgi:hypothetical protein